MPTIPRLYVPADLTPGATIAGTTSQAHYLGTVLRCQPGDPVHLFNGRDGEWQARIAALRRDRALPDRRDASAARSSPSPTCGSCSRY